MTTSSQAPVPMRTMTLIAAIIAVTSLQITAQDVGSRSVESELIDNATSIAYSLGPLALHAWLERTGQSLPYDSRITSAEYGDKAEAGDVIMFLFHSATEDSGYVVHRRAHRRHMLELRLLSDRTDTSRILIDAWKSISSEGEQALIKAHEYAALGQHSHAASQYGDAATCFRTVGFTLFEADARMRRGELLLLDKRRDSALIELRQAMALFTKERYTRGVARSAYLIAEVRLRDGATSEALALARQSRALFEEIRDPAGAGLSCLLLSALQERDGDLNRARATRQDGLRHFRALRDGYMFAGAQLLQAAHDVQTGRYTAALSIYDTLRTHFVPGMTPSMRTLTEVQTAALGSMLHYHDLTRAAITDATELIERFGMEEHRGDLWLHQANLEFIRGSLDSAQALCLASRHVFEQRQDHHGLARTLLLEVRMHSFMHRKDDARHVLARLTDMKIRDARLQAEVRCEEALLREYDRKQTSAVIRQLHDAERAALLSGDLSLRGRILIILGDQYRNIDDHRAADCYAQADSLLEYIGDVYGQCGAIIKRADLAVFSTLAADSSQARSHLRRALRSMEHLDVPEVRAYALLELSNLERTLKDKTELAGTALDLLEQARRRMQLPRNKETYFGKIARYYERIFRFFLDIGHPGDFYVAQLMKARSFLDQISDTEQFPRGSIPAELRQELYRTASEVEATNVRLIRRNVSQEETQSLTSQLRQLREKEDDIRRRILSTNPHLGGQSSVEPVAIPTLRSSVLRPGEALLEYLVVGENAWLFVFRTDRYSGPIRIGTHERSAASNTSSELGQIRMVVRNKIVLPCNEPRREISRLLFEPAQPWLAGATHLIIAPDSNLALFPFEALITGMHPDGEPRYLIEDYAISYVQSATALAMLRTRASNATLQDPSFTGIGAPVDPMTFASRLGTTQRRSGSARALPADVLDGSLFTPGVRQTRDVLRRLGNEPLPELKASRDEVCAISAQFERNGRAARVLLDGEATEHAAKELLSSPTTHIHFACHGYYYQGVQCLFLTPEPRLDEDGFLGVDEIISMDLSRVQLVVLSACQSAQGKLQSREGLTGFLRAFLIAGARSVIGTTWSVDDTATARFMEQFYEAMLGRGMEPRDALRDVKIRMMRDPKYRYPCYWAPFVLYGH